MPLQIRDQRAHTLARELAEKRKISMTDAVIQALEGELRRESELQPLAARLGRIADELAAQAGSAGRAMTPDEIAQMWGRR